MKTIRNYFLLPLNQRRNSRKAIDIALFFLFTICFAFLPYGGLEKTSDGYLYLFGGVKNLTFFLLVFLPFLVLGIYLVLELSLSGETRINKVSAVVLILFLLFRLSFYVFFPKGEVDYSFTYSGKEYLVPYSGLPLYGRMVGFLEEAGFGFYFFFLLNFLPALPMGEKMRDFFCWIWVLFAVVLVVYSIVKEHDGLLKNLECYLKNPQSGFFMDCHSFTNHRNVFGFFLFVGAIDSLILYYHKPRVILPILFTLFSVFAFLIVSKTPMFLLVALGILSSFLYPFFFFKKHKGYAISSLILGFFALALLLVLVFLIFLLPKDSIFYLNWYKPLRHMLLEGGTVNARLDLTKAAISMLLSSPFYTVFGFGRVSFLTVFQDYKGMVGGIDMFAHTSHNAFVDTWMEIGSLGLLLLVSGLVLMVVFSIKGIREKKMSYSIYILVVLFLIAYGSFEMRIVFGYDYSQAIEMVAILFPFLLDKKTNLQKKPKDLLLKRL